MNDKPVDWWPMRTYAESKNMKTINWKKIISNPKIDLFDYADYMDDWRTCFCGQLSIKLPRKIDESRKVDGSPVDTVLNSLCGENAVDIFVEAAQSGNRSNLINLLSLVEQRSEYILSEMKKHKKSD